MTDTRDWADEKATSIVDVWYAVHVPPGADVRFSPLIDAIAAALRAAARVQPGHVREGDTDRKVLGELCTTAEGDVVSDGARVYYVGESSQGEPFVCEWDVSGAGDHIPVETFYRTRAAAEAARTAGEGE